MLVLEEAENRMRPADAGEDSCCCENKTEGDIACKKSSRGDEDDDGDNEEDNYVLVDACGGGGGGGGGGDGDCDGDGVCEGDGDDVGVRRVDDFCLTSEETSQAVKSRQQTFTSSTSQRDLNDRNK
eukprot:684354-Hanusia_phi.AAC.1